MPGTKRKQRRGGRGCLRAVAGEPSDLQIMYGPAGERRLTEWEVPWLPGYERSKPVRIGNAASEQFQLDVYGEVVDALYQSRVGDIAEREANTYNLIISLLDFLEDAWKQPDEGIWEVRGPRQHFTQSKVMAWVAFDRVVRILEKHPDDGDAAKVPHWKSIRDEIHDEICTKAYDADRKTFVQSYGSTNLDAALLMMPLVGFLPASDERMRGTVEAIQKGLTTNGFVARYSTDQNVDGLPPGEGVFLPCTFWLADNLALMGRGDEARSLFERLLGLANDVGLLAEEYDPVGKRQLGNFPQAFTHVSLVNSACKLSSIAGVGSERLGHARHHRLAGASLDLGGLPASRNAGGDLELDRHSRGDASRPVSDSGAMERERLAVVRFDLPQAATLVERADVPAATAARPTVVAKPELATATGGLVAGGQWTILAIGNSMMPVAPCSLSAGMSVLISDLATTVSTA